MPRESPVAVLDILVIEDDLDAGCTLADVLQLEGHRVRVASDGHTGLALARERPPDVVLCDIVLPDTSGYDLAKAVRAEAALSRTQLVALTGCSDPEDQRRAVEAGFDAHLPKPATLETLHRLLMHAAPRPERT
jgi:two-component system CheB/CheR fusion protein